MLCPKTLKPCCDDLCHGSGCLDGGGEMIPTCGKCGGPMVTHDGEPDTSGMWCEDCAEDYENELAADDRAVFGDR